MKNTFGTLQLLNSEKSLYLFMKATSRFLLECVKKSKLEIMPEIHF